MAITRLFTTGFEVGHSNETPIRNYTGNHGTTTKKTGSYGFVSTQGFGGIHVYKIIPATRQIRTGFWFNPNGGNNTTVDRSMFAVRSSFLGTVLARLEMYSQDFIIDIAGTNQDTETDGATESAWIHIGIDLKIHSSAGWFVVYKNGVEILRFEGNTGDSDIIEVDYGPSENVISISIYFDDIYLDDTTGEAAAAVLPMYQFPYVVSNGNGNYNGNWEGSDGNNVDDYALVDDIPANTSDYVEETAADQLESFTLTTYTLQANEACSAVIPTAVCQRLGGTELLALGLRENATDDIGSDLTPTTTWLGIQGNRETLAPDTSAWNQSEIDGLEVIIKSRGTYS